MITASEARDIMWENIADYSWVDTAIRLAISRGQSSTTVDVYHDLKELLKSNGFSYTILPHDRITISW